MAELGIKELLEAGVHFGHQTRRWNPKMRRFIFGERDGIYIIDLLQTQRLLEEARRFAAELAARGGILLFVGTKKQARDAIRDVAQAAEMPYVNHRWLGGLLTNWGTISQRIRRLHDLERYEAEGQLQLLPTRERMAMQADLEKLRANLGGVKEMQRVPDAVFVIDLKTEAIAVREAQRLRLPIIGLVDTNCDPDGIDYVIPGNDDAIRSCAAVTKAIGDVVAQGHFRFRAEEERARREAEEQERREAEERARREAEEAERLAAEAAAAEASAAGAAAEPGGVPSPPGPAPEPSSPAGPAPSVAEPQSELDRTRSVPAADEVPPPASETTPNEASPEPGPPAEPPPVPPASAPQPPPAAGESEEAPAEAARAEPEQSPAPSEPEQPLEPPPVPPASAPQPPPAAGESEEAAAEAARAEGEHASAETVPEESQ